MSTIKFLRKPLKPATAALEVDRVVSTIVQIYKPRAILLFGSANLKNMSDQSDIDLLLLFENQEEMRLARKAVSKARPFSDYPLDLVWMTVQDYKKKSKIGGLAQIVSEEGTLVFGDIND